MPRRGRSGGPAALAASAYASRERGPLYRSREADHQAWESALRVSHETILPSLFIQARGVLKKELMVHLPARKRRWKSLSAPSSLLSAGFKKLDEHPRKVSDSKINLPWWNARKNIKLFVDSRPARSKRKWRQTPRPAPRNIPCPAQSKLLYKSSGPDTASAQHSRRTQCAVRER
jgi:hypothetical protein